MVNSDLDYPQPQQRSLGRRALKPLIVLIVGLVVGYLVVGFVGAVDWSAVGDAMGRLSVVELTALLALLLLRQTLNAVPLRLFVPGLSLSRSLRNDLVAVTSGTFAPPPADIVMRIAMFKSWGIDPVTGMAGVTLNMIAFYAVRFVTPALGVLVVVHRGVETGDWLLALGSIAIAGVIIAGVVLVMRADALAAVLGRTAARVVGRFNDRADPQEWAAAVVGFRGKFEGTVRSGLVGALAAMLVMVVVDGSMLLLALRFVGVTGDQLPWYEVYSAFLVTYPLTLLPLFGLGPLDAALIAAFVELAGLAVEPEVVAALAVWRTVTIIGPLALGGAALLRWRAADGRAVQQWLNAEAGPE